MIKRLFTALFLGLLLAAAATPRTWAENLCDLNQGSVGPRSLTEACDAAGKAITKQPMKTLQRVVVEQQVRALARFLRKTPEASKIGSFVYTPVATEFLQLCCSCIPNKTCSATVPGNVCSLPNSDGSCPGGTLRTICTLGPTSQDDVCDSVD
jgi:hypothetical protein